MKERKRAVFNWSGGKDSAMALQKAIKSNEYEIISLLTTINRDTKKSSMHAIPVSILENQARSIGIPIYLVDLTPKGDMSNYNLAMTKAVDHFKAQGVTHFIFGDIFLHDVRDYREQNLKPHGIEVIEPLWNKSSEELMLEFLNSGLKTIIVTTMSNLLGKEYIGKLIDKRLVENFPSEIDVCGENGEYHTLCFDGPIFKFPIDFSLGEPYSFTYEVKMEDGQKNQFSYWFANIEG